MEGRALPVLGRGGGSRCWPPDAGADACSDVAELGSRGPLIPAAAATALALSALVEDLALAAAVDAEAEVEGAVPSARSLVSIDPVSGGVISGLCGVRASVPKVVSACS